MAQKTFVDEVLTASDVNTYLAGEGGAWTAWTPQVDQGASTNITKTVTYSNYARYGRTIHWSFSITMTAAGTAGSPVTLTVPTAAVLGGAITGSFRILDSSTQNWYVGTINGESTTSIGFQYNTTATSARWGQSPNLALASGDILVGSVTYEAAS